MGFRSATALTLLFLNITLNSVIGNPAQNVYNLPKEFKGFYLNSTTGKRFLRGGFIPDLPRSLQVNDTTLSVDLDGAEGTLILSDSIVTGLDLLVNDATLDLITLKANASFYVPTKAAFSGVYHLDGKVSPGDEESISAYGSGPFMIIVTNLNSLIDLKLEVGLLSRKVSLADLNLQVAFDSIYINAADFELNDETVDWDSLNGELNHNFESIWGEFVEPLTLALKEGINELISETTLTDFIDLFEGKKSFEEVITPAKIKY